MRHTVWFKIEITCSLHLSVEESADGDKNILQNIDVNNRKKFILSYASQFELTCHIFLIEVIYIRRSRYGLAKWRA